MTALVLTSLTLRYSTIKPNPALTQRPPTQAPKPSPPTRYNWAIITDEAQFFTPAQIDQLRMLVDEEDIPVLCFGLRTDFLTHFFPGSQRLMELADSLTEIKTVCACGSKATVNARIDGDGKIVTEGAQVMLGGNDSYVAMCHQCWTRKIREQRGE